MALTQPILSDIFQCQDVKKILNNKFVILIGDSVMRSMYKDMVKLCQKNEHLFDCQLKHKGELTFEKDRLMEGGQLGTMSNDTSYTEVREFQTSHILIRFYFITRCNSDYLRYICQTIREDSEKPDVVIMNSCYWDLSRYGPRSVEEYKINLPIGVQSVLNVIPKETVFIWTSALPVSKEIYGGFMGTPGTTNIDESVRTRIRENAVEANRFAAQVMNDLGVDFLDLHYYFRLQEFRRAYDGIHWDATAHRRITNLILHHLCDCWDIKTPGRFVISVRDESSQEVTTDDEAKEKKKELLVDVEVKKDGDEAKKTEDETSSSSSSDQVRTSNNSQINPASSPTSSTSSIENRKPEMKSKKAKEAPPKNNVIKTISKKQQRRATAKKNRRHFGANQQITNYQQTNNIPQQSGDLFQSTTSYYSTQSFFNSNNTNSNFYNFMNTQTQSFNQRNFYNNGYNFNDNMLNCTNFNFSNNQNPYSQNSYNNTQYFSNNNSNSYSVNNSYYYGYNNQMGNNLSYQTYQNSYNAAAGNRRRYNR